jgi:hypothetical protein
LKAGLYKILRHNCRQGDKIACNKCLRLWKLSKLVNDIHVVDRQKLFWLPGPGALDIGDIDHAGPGRGRVLYVTNYEV